MHSFREHLWVASRGECDSLWWKSRQYFFPELFKFKMFMGMSVLPTCVSVMTCMKCSGRPEEGRRSFGTEVLDGCETLCGCLEPNLSSLLGQLVLLTGEPSPQPPFLKGFDLYLVDSRYKRQKYGCEPEDKYFIR